MHEFPLTMGQVVIYPCKEIGFTLDTDPLRTHMEAVCNVNQSYDFDFDPLPSCISGIKIFFGHALTLANLRKVPYFQIWNVLRSCWIMDKFNVKHHGSVRLENSYKTLKRAIYLEL